MHEFTLSNHALSWCFSGQGLGVVCNKDGGFTEDDFVVEFLGEVILHRFISYLDPNK